MIYCLQFGLHIWGRVIGGLTVYRKDIDNKRERLFTWDKVLGNDWHTVSMTVLHTSSFVVRARVKLSWSEQPEVI